MVVFTEHRMIIMTCKWLQLHVSKVILAEQLKLLKLWKGAFILGQGILINVMHGA